MNNYLMPQAQFGYPPQQPCCPPQAPRPEVNAVKIELNNPQAYGGSPMAQAPMQQSAPMMPPPAPIYSYPQAPIYQPQMMPEMGPPIMAPMPFIPQQPINQQIINPTPAPVPPTEQFVPQQEQPVPPVAPAVVNQQPEVPPAQEQRPTLDINPILTSLKSPNMEEQFSAIQKIAEVGQTETPEADTLINEQIFQNLASIVKRDTSQMPGPTTEQIQLREKKFTGGQLTPQEDKVAEQLSPQEIAEMNKQYATYTLAVMQKNFRNTVNKEAAKQGLEPVKLNEIPEINTVIENVKANPNPLIREASISALSYVAKPEDQEPLGLIFNLATQDADPMVQDTAAKALDKLNKPQ